MKISDKTANEMMILTA